MILLVLFIAPVLIGLIGLSVVGLVEKLPAYKQQLTAQSSQLQQTRGVDVSAFASTAESAGCVLNGFIVLSSIEVVNMSIFSEIVRENRFLPEDVPKFEAKLFFEGDRRRRYWEQFGVLLSLSVIIATMGVIGNSTATVIGAMIIAPLMTPIMATTASLLTGQTERGIRSTLLVIAGVAGVVALSWLCGALFLAIDRVISFQTNPQITSRVSPDLVDLVAALAAGAAGAFAMSRDDISDSLAGVAISISLVPPLCVVGIGLAAGERAAASGALLLFITNYLSILLAGGGVLALLGLARARSGTINESARRKAYVAIAIAILIVAVPLALTGARIAAQSIEQQQTKSVTEAWVSETEFDLQYIQTDFLTGKINISISGSGEPPSLAVLGPQLEAVFQKPVEITLDIIPADLKHYPAPPSEDTSGD